MIESSLLRATMTPATQIDEVEKRGMMSVVARVARRMGRLTCHFHSDVLHEFMFRVGPQCMISSPNLLVSFPQTSRVLVQ